MQQTAFPGTNRALGAELALDERIDLLPTIDGITTSITFNYREICVLLSLPDHDEQYGTSSKPHMG
jgi:hypothetical protein